MKPYPLAGLNHFTVPVGIVVSVAVSTCRADGAAASTISGSGGTRPERRARRVDRPDQRIVEPALCPDGQCRTTRFQGGRRAAAVRPGPCAAAVSLTAAAA